MKKLIILMCISFIVLTACNQSNNKQTTPPKQEIKENVRYKMFPTENMWTFLKLDTRNGKIWQVQYAIDESFRGEIELNNNALVSDGAAENGRFTLYPTRNVYNFILLDQIDGKMWQVQWSLEENNRGLIPLQ